MADEDATTLPGADLVPPVEGTGSLIAKGTVVSFFQGGLAAVRINEDLSKAVSNNNSKAAAPGSTTNSDTNEKSGLPNPTATSKNFKSDAGT